MRGKRRRIIYAAATVTLVLVALFTWLVSGSYIPVLDPSGVVADQQRTLFWFTIGLSAIVVIPVFTLLGVFAWKYRAGSNTAKAQYQPEWAENDKLEAIWWGIPIAIIAVLAVVTYVTSHSLDPYRRIASDQPTLEVQVVALQWKWLFIYPEEGIASVNQLHIPVDRPVHFSLTADAPMSAFWIPALGSQIYSMNSMSSQLNLMATETGTYKGYNTNINGEGYADMVFDTVVTSSAEYSDWLTRAQSSSDHLDSTSYNSLRQPNTMEPKDYILHDRRLYDTIVSAQSGSHNTTQMIDTENSHNGHGGGM